MHTTTIERPAAADVERADQADDLMPRVERTVETLGITVTIIECVKLTTNGTVVRGRLYQAVTGAYELRPGRKVRPTPRQGRAYVQPGQGEIIATTPTVDAACRAASRILSVRKVEGLPLVAIPPKVEKRRRPEAVALRPVAVAGQIAADLLDGAELDWRDRALCSQVDPEAFFPENGESTREAKRVCGRCDVRAECLADALDIREEFGVRGGLSGRERRVLLKRWGASAGDVVRVDAGLPTVRAAASAAA
jgi:WhiB family redox-sensing transcriptional regulator